MKLERGDLRFDRFPSVEVASERMPTVAVASYRKSPCLVG